MNDRPGRLSGRTALGLMAALCLLFAGLVLASALRFFPKDQSIQAAAAEPERLLTGADDPGRVALELLPGETLDLNSASAEELEKLPGIGSKLAAAIVAYREEHGPFRSVEDLLQVPGIGEKRLEAIRDLVTVDPQA